MWEAEHTLKAQDPKSKPSIRFRWFSTLLREARIALYSFSVGETDPGSRFYLGYLRGVESAQNASYMNVYRKVLAVQSGGRVLDQSYDLVQEMESCVRQAGVFYTLSFDPPHADHPDEYHELKVQIGKPGLTARTNTGYYNQPYYPTNPTLRPSESRLSSWSNCWTRFIVMGMGKWQGNFRPCN